MYVYTYTYSTVQLSAQKSGRKASWELEIFTESQKETLITDWWLINYCNKPGKNDRRYSYSQWWGVGCYGLQDPGAPISPILLPLSLGIYGAEVLDGQRWTQGQQQHTSIIRAFGREGNNNSFTIRIPWIDRSSAEADDTRCGEMGNIIYYIILYHIPD